MSEDCKMIVLVDFDCFLRSRTSSWDCKDILLDPPVFGVIDWLETFLTRHCDHPIKWNHAVTGDYKVCIYSMKNKTNDSVKAMKEWLLKYGLAQDWIDMLEFPVDKPLKWLTKDASALCFDRDLTTLTEKIL